MAYTTIDNPELYFQVKTWTGTGSSNALTLDGDEDMQPDYVMIKQRSSTQQWNGYDDLRGVQEYLGWNTNIAENTQSQGLTAFGSDGFTVGTDDMVNKSSSTYVAFCWKESATAGFDMITYSGTGSAKNESHSLSATPHWIVTKCRSDAQSWATHHKSYSATEKVMYLDNNNALASTDPDWLTAVSSSTISLGGSGSDANVSGRTYVAYLWSEIQGYSKFGSYTGNGNADGATVWCGFSPAFVLIKSTASGVWRLWDNKRDRLNPNTANFQTNASDAEYDHSSVAIDFLSSGFKARSTDSSYNGSGTTYVFMAFAEQPFVNSNGVPCNAR
jgi:hypothetical protein